MKKTLVIASLVAAASLIGTTTYAIVDNTPAPAAESTTTPALIATTNFAPTTANLLSSSKDETVYAIAEPSGIVQKTFIGNALASDGKSLPVDLAITYTLDDAEISSSDLVGQSGHVTINFAYRSRESYQNTPIPFIAISGVMLDSAKFSNITITNGKIISSGSHTVLVGYGIAGLPDTLDADFILSSFAIEADVQDFTLDTTYTVFTNSLLADLDTSKLTSVDELVNSISLLGENMDRILAGANDLSNGLKSALDGAANLAAGSDALASGATALAAGASELADGLNTVDAAITSTSSRLTTRASEVLSKFLTPLDSLADSAINNLPELANLPSHEEIAAYLEENYQLSYPLHLTPANYQEIITQILTILEANNIDTNYLSSFAASIGNLATNYQEELESSLAEYSENLENLTASAKQLVSGANDLAAGAAELAAGSRTLQDGAHALHSGLEKLYQGSSTLVGGLATFKSEGIDRLVNFATEDLAGFTYKLRKSVDAARSYTHFMNPGASSVKFIFKTNSIK